MQVSQIAELDTHAVIGGGQAQSFGMSDSAEFFTVLSDTLYRDKVRAVAREVICNAWDAHTMVGANDRPVEILLDDDQLVIKDFGPGIADDRIVPIYCVYGASTKVKDENQTGGFGLGSKAPFAYADHFSVASCHAGFRTVYAISRGGLETQGKPDIRAMVKVPTEQTGITVTIPIRNPDDRKAFRKNIEAVVKQGGIKATLNGETISTIDWAPTKKIGFSFQSTHELNVIESRVYCLYGSVLYPVSSTNSEIQNAVRGVSQFFTNEHVLVIAAPASSIGVTPSRESLSYSDRTIATLVKLITHAQKIIERNALPEAIRVVRNTAKKMERDKLVITRDAIRYQFQTGRTYSTPSNEISAIARVAARACFPALLSNEQCVRLILRQVAKTHKDERRAFRRLAATPDHRSINIEVRNWRHSTRLPLRVAARTGLLKNLFVWSGRYYDDQKKVTPIGERRWTGWLAKTVVIAPNQRDAIKICKENRTNSFDHDERNRSMLVFVLPRSQRTRALELEQALQTIKLDVVLGNFDKVASAPKKKIEFAFYSFDRVNSSTYTPSIKDEERSLNKAPYYLTVRGGITDLVLPLNLNIHKKDVLRFYPTIALSQTVHQEAKLKALGAVNVVETMLNDLEALVDDPQAQYASLIHNRDIFRGSGRTSGSSKAEEAAKVHPRIAQFLFPVPFKLNATYDKTRMLLTVLARGVDYGRRDLKERSEEIVSRLLLNAEDKLHPYRIPVSSRDQYDYMKYIDVDNSSADDPTSFIAFLRFAQRKFSKPTPKQTLKEAA